MLRGLRVSDAATFTRLVAGDNRTFLRLGALLEVHLAFTESALEFALSTAPGRALVVDQRLKACVRADFPALAQELGCKDLGLALYDGDSGAESGWRVVALEDELNNPLTASAAAEAEASLDAALPQLSALVPTLSPAIRVPLEGLLQARADDQRAAALEQLRYAMPPLPVVSELMPMILSDGAELVRERAIGLLAGAGAHSLVVDLIRALIRRDDQALARLHEAVGRLPATQLDVVVAAILAALARGVASQALVDCCRSIAPHLAHHRSLPRLLELLLPTRLSLLDLVRALQAIDSQRVSDALTVHLGLSPDRDAQLVILLADPRARGSVPERERLLAIGLDLLISPRELPPERMGLAAALLRLTTEASLSDRIAERADRLGASYDTSVYWLIAELCRDGHVSEAAGERLAKALRSLLREAAGPHLIAILEQQLPALVPASDHTRTALVEPMVETIARFIDERTRDLVETCLAANGAPAIQPLWALLAEHPHLEVRLVASELLPLLLATAGADDARAAIQRLIATAAKAEQARERAALLKAAAQLATTPSVAEDPAPARAVDAALEGLGRWRTEAIGHLAASSHLGEERRAKIVEDLLAELTAELPDTADTTVTDAATDEVTFIIDERLGQHTEFIPVVISALARIAISPSLPREHVRTIVARMCLQWRRVSQWRIVWGPGNIQELGRALGSLAEQGDFPGPLRIQVCEALLPSISQLAIARALARVFTASDGAFLSRLAGKAAERLVALCSENYYAEDEHDALTDVLVDYLAIPHLGADATAVRRRLITVIGVIRNSLTSRARAKLRYLISEIDAELRPRLDWVQ